MSIEHLPLVVINFATDDVNLSKGESMGYMSIQPLEISENYDRDLNRTLITYM